MSLLPASRGVNQQGTRTPISHVIFVMMENHSFDNFFGTYPDSANGTNNLGIEVPTNLLNLQNPPALTQVPPGNFSTVNPTEGNRTYHLDWDNGKMDGFAANSGPQSMTYFTSSQIPIEWDWAQEYSLGDMYFSSLLTETDPNRLMSLAGVSPISADYGPPPNVPLNDSIMYQLSTNGISWGYYINDPSADIFPLDYFTGIDNYSQNIQSWSSFFSSLQNGTLPSVSWVMPVGGGASDVSQHPSENVTNGELWLANVVNSVMQSSYWNSSAIFLTYDEGGGYYDQVPPPIVGETQLGFRVPFLVISPYAKEDYISSTVLNHASILSFIEYNWGLPALNAFVGSSNVPLDFFDFNQSYPGSVIIRAPVVVPSNTSFPLPLQIPLSSLPYARSGSSSVLLSTAGAGSSSSSTQSTTSVIQLPTTSSGTQSSNGSTASSIDLVSVASVLTVMILITVAAGVFVTRRRQN
jgi:phospholipase C